MINCYFTSLGMAQSKLFLRKLCVLFLDKKEVNKFSKWLILIWSCILVRDTLLISEEWLD